MKKVLLAALISMSVVTTAGAFGLPKADLGGDKIKLNKCLMEEGQKALTTGKLTPNTVKQVAEDAAKTCAVKLALKSDNAANVELAISVMEKLVK